MKVVKRLFVLLKSIFLTVYLDSTRVSATAPLVGYFSEGFIRVMEYSLNKEPHVLTQLLKPAKNITDRMDENGKLSFLGDVATTQFHNFFKKLHHGDYNETITYMKDLKYIMENRRELCSAELNVIIDIANAIILKTDGENIYALIDEYKQFPKVNKTEEQLCQELIEAFVNPFLKKKGKSIMQYLVHSINDLGEGEQCDTSIQTKVIVDYLRNRIKQQNPVAEDNDEGYVVQAYLKFLEAILYKHDYYSRQVFKHTDDIIQYKINEEYFFWMLELKDSIPLIIANYFQMTNVSIIKADIPEKLLYNKVKKRKIHFDEDLNELIDLANEFITDDQKDELFEIIEDFKHYPISNKTGKKTCEDLIDGFCKPFSQNKNKIHRDDFIDEIRRILRREYGNLQYKIIFKDNNQDDVYIDIMQFLKKTPKPATNALDQEILP